ncbi:hypothetical protein HBZC1_p0190 (plasmid) [Helicobacter bizzozeronii CIII-1]|uniref:Uncharacterized protein n=1 Tax=Helicobacter bizzozeronii (strain CIII-1) TaxID=1002804 RepID=F8KUG4_HELBC|nr:hypothetical protein HBZC1_p0190 [Helicobacter bizzozeronii CIII-1]
MIYKISETLAKLSIFPCSYFVVYPPQSLSTPKPCLILPTPNLALYELLKAL